MIDSFTGKYKFLSNFGLAEIEYKGKFYPTSEHLYQALKTSDSEEHEFVRISPTPGEAKNRGKKITRRENWDEAKDGVMKMILRLKFQQNPNLAQQLLDTGSQELIEGNTWGDLYWGKCFGNGQNKLGIFLQELRDELIAEFINGENCREQYPPENVV